MDIIKFDPVEIGAAIAAVTVVTQLIKSGFERLEEWQSAPAWIRSFAEWWAHSKGPIIISGLVAFLVETAPGMIQDGTLDITEISTILQILGVGGLANVVYWISRRKSPIK